MAKGWIRSWCTNIPLDTPLARSVTADPGTEMIEHDLLLLHKVGAVEPHMRGLMPPSLY